MIRPSFPYTRQLDASDCGPACLKMVAAYHGGWYSITELRERTGAGRDGSSLFGLEVAARSLGMEAISVSIPFHGDSDEPALVNAPLPLIAHWGGDHFVVVYRITSRSVYLADPALGKRKLGVGGFIDQWQGQGGKGRALLLEPGPEWSPEKSSRPEGKLGAFFRRYLTQYRSLLIQVVIGLVVVGLLQLALPFLSQAVVDIGVANRDIQFIWLVLIAQLALFGGQITVQFLQSWVLLHISTRVNVRMVSDFLSKLFRLPVRFFDLRWTGDLLQRIDDQYRIERFLTTSSLQILFSAFTFVTLGVVLLIYQWTLFVVYLVATAAYVGWVLRFLRRREVIDHQRFEQLSRHQHAVIEMIQGVRDIKLSDSGAYRRENWLEVQADLFRANMNNLRLEQYQQGGGSAILQIKDLLLSFLAALAVVRGEMTLGMLLAVQFIIGQLNVPLQQLISFLRLGQDAWISWQRLGEIQREKEESSGEERAVVARGDLHLDGVSFRYQGPGPDVLADISLRIPEGQMTAIVGSSGSGKSTLLQLLLGLYTPTRGRIRVGAISLSRITPSHWRQQCGAVLQDGFIFSDTLLQNIVEGTKAIDSGRLETVIRTAQLGELVSQLPQGLSTRVGSQGSGLSQGQRQRVLIARALYKDPAYLFLDEATNALDARTERKLVEALPAFLAGRTVVVAAHRLSTVRQADQIVVMNQGRVVETGTHAELVEQGGAYYQLVADQLDA